MKDAPPLFQALPNQSHGSLSISKQQLHSIRQQTDPLLLACGDHDAL